MRPSIKYRRPDARGPDRRNAWRRPQLADGAGATTRILRTQFSLRIRVRRGSERISPACGGGIGTDRGERPKVEMPKRDETGLRRRSDDEATGLDFLRNTK